MAGLGFEFPFLRACGGVWQPIMACGAGDCEEEMREREIGEGGMAIVVTGLRLRGSWSAEEW